MSKSLILVAWGGIGDVVVCTPTIRALKETNPQQKIIVYCAGPGQEAVLRHNPHIDSLRTLTFKCLWRYPYHLFAFYFKRSLIPYTLLFFQRINPTQIYNKHVKDIVPDMFGIKLKTSKAEIFLTEEEKSKAREMLFGLQNVVLMHIHSRSSVNHLWPVSKWNELVCSLPQFTFIQTGLPDEEKVNGALDWTGKTNIREVMALMYLTTSFIGVDSSLAHISNAFNVPGVVLFGDSSPVFWGHENNINIYKDVACSPCYYYLWKNPCPYDHECMQLITVDEVKTALIVQVEKSKKQKDVLQVA